MSEPAKEVEKDCVDVDGLDEVFEAMVSEPSGESVQTESTPFANREQEGLTLSEAASEFGVSKHTVRRWIKEGKIEAYKINGERGPEWRVYGDHPEHNVDVDLTEQTNFQPPGQHTGPQQSSPAIELLMEQLEFIREMKGELEGLTFRNGYLQAQLENKEEQLKLLPDFEAQKEKAELERRQKEEETKLANRELEAVQNSYSKLEREHLALKQEMEKYEAMANRSSWKKFSDWMMGRREE